MPVTYGTGAADGSSWQIQCAIANNEAFYLRGLAGVDSLAGYSVKLPDVVGGAFPFTMGFYMYTKPRMMTMPGTGVAHIGGSNNPTRLRCHYYRRLLIVGPRTDNMEKTISPQIDKWVDYYDDFMLAHQSMREPLWQATYTILPGVMVVPTASNPTHAYQWQGTAAGVTGGTEPTWADGVVDGTVTWTQIGAPLQAVTNMAEVTEILPFAIRLNEETQLMGVAYTVEATSFPRVTVSL